MLYFSRWKAAAIILTAFAVCLFAVPNFFSADMVKRLPQWAQRHVVLGLDLQGGSHILLEVDSAAVRKEKVQTLLDDVRRILREAKIGYTGLVARGDGVELRIREGQDVQLALTKLRELSQPLGGLLSATGQRSIDVTENGGLIQLKLTEAGITERMRQAVEQSIQIIERRVNELGTVEPLIQRQGIDRILVQVPGLQDPQRLKGSPRKDRQADLPHGRPFHSGRAGATGAAPPESEVLYTGKMTGRPYLIEKRVVVSGEDLTDAQPGFDQRTAEPIVSFRFNTNGARRFAQATQENVGRPFAIVLDNEVISAPVIREPILGGSGQISGSFTVQAANDLAILLRAGALPAPLTIIEERTVGPGLGQDSIEKGELAAYVGSIMVIVFMLVTYRLFGVFANIAVAINVAMIFGVLSLLNATLTLPGIAGIVLTVGIAVDSNVLIYERIREEVRAGRTADRGHRRRLQPGARHHPRFEHHDLHRRRGAVLHRHRPGARLRRDARHRHPHHAVHRLHHDAADRRLVGEVEASPVRSDLRSAIVLVQLLIAAIGLALVVLCALVVFGYIPHLRLVPDDTKFDFMRFRRVSFPVSALLSVVAIALFFFHGLNFGIDFDGGTLMEVQSKAGQADLAKMREELAKLNLGEVQLQQFGAPTDVLIRIAQQPGGDAAQQEAVAKVSEVAWRFGRLPPRRGGRPARLRASSCRWA